MKFFQIGFLLVLSIALAHGQSLSCDQLVKVEYDSSRGEYTRASIDDLTITDGKGTMLITFIEMDRTIIMSVNVKGAGDCLDESSKATFTFTDDTKLILPHNGEFNCDAEFSTFFGGDFGHKKELTQLVNKEIKTLHISTRKSAIDKQRVNFVELQVPGIAASKIKGVLACLLEK